MVISQGGGRISQSQRQSVGRPLSSIQFKAKSIYNCNMETIKYVYWKDQGMWLGYLQEYPDYMTQAESLGALQENLRDLYKDLTSGEIPGVRKVAELSIS